MAIPSSCLAVQGNVVSAVAQGFRHPDKFVQEFISASDERLVEEFSRFIKNLAYGTKVHVPKNINQSEFAHHRQKVLDRPDAAEWAGRDSHDTGSLVDIFFQATVQNM